RRGLAGELGGWRSARWGAPGGGRGTAPGAPLQGIGGGRAPGCAPGAPARALLPAGVRPGRPGAGAGVDVDRRAWRLRPTTDGSRWAPPPGARALLVVLPTSRKRGLGAAAAAPRRREVRQMTSVRSRVGQRLAGRMRAADDAGMATAE